MNKFDLRSKETKLTILVLGMATLIGFSVPISFLIDPVVAESIFLIDQSGSIGLGIIIVATTGGIFGALVIRRRSSFQYWSNIVCKKTGELMYEDENRDKLFCPSHGEVERDMWSDDKHFTWKPTYDEQHNSDTIRMSEKPTKAILENKIDELESKLDRLHTELSDKNTSEIDSYFGDVLSRDEFLKRNKDKIL